MARIDDAIPAPELSVLDRLLDDEPDRQRAEGPVDWRSGIGKVRAAVLRDVHWILNARTGEVFSEEQRGKLPPEGPERTLASAVVRYGLRDFCTLDLRNEKQQLALRQRILFALRAFEPRLDQLKVEIKSAAEDAGRTRFHIEARLRSDPEPMAVAFDATVMWRDRRVEVG